MSRLAMTDEERYHFDLRGFLVVRDALTPDEIAACRPYLEQQLALVDPTVIVTLGNFSSKLLLETDVGITKLRGRSYRFGDPERHLVPTFHPAAALRGGADVLARMRADLVRAKVLMGDR